MGDKFSRRLVKGSLPNVISRSFSGAGVRVKAGVSARRAWPLLRFQRSVAESFEGEGAIPLQLAFEPARISLRRA